MALPDASKLSSLPDETWRALGVRFDALGLNAGLSRPILTAAKRVSAPLRRPILTWHFRQAREPWALAMRMLTVHDPVTRDEARAALGELLDPLLDAGLLVKKGTADGELVSPFVLHLLDGLYLFADDLSQRGDAVMAVSGTTVALSGAAAPRERSATAPLESCLDVGCGAGAIALRLSRRARRTVGTDINLRAIAIARVNAALNGIHNVELREGHLFEPVRGERFDLIVSQPPFVPRPEGAAGSAFLYGGARGDELALELLSGVSRHLTERGRALLMLEWPEHEDEPIATRVRRATGADNVDDVDVLLLRAPPTSADEHASNYAAVLHPTLGAAFEEEVMNRRDHLERMGIRGLSMTLTVLERATGALGRPGWTDTLEVHAVTALNVTSDRIDKLMAARSLPGNTDRLLSTRLRLPEGLALTQQDGEQPGEPAVVSARFPEGSLSDAIDMSPDLLAVVTAIHEAPDVRAGLHQFAEAYGARLEEALDQLLPVVEQALRHGLLEIDID